MKLIPTSLKLPVFAVVVAGFVSSAQAWIYTGTGPWANYLFADGWLVHENGWGSQNDQTQEIQIQNPGQWQSTVNYTGSGTKNFAHMQQNVNIGISSGNFCNCSFNYYAPNNPWWFAFFDMWTGSSPATDELMIGQGWNNVNGGGWGTTIATGVTIGGRYWPSVSQANNGANNVIIFNGQTSRSSGSEDLMAYFLWCQSRGLLHNSTLGGFNFGFEVTYTSGYQTFGMNSLFVNWGANGQVGTGVYKIIARHSGKALDAYGNGSANGTQIDQWTYGEGNNQLWSVWNRGNNQYSIIGIQTGKSLDINGFSTSNGTKVQLWDYSGSSNQKFTFSGTSGGYYRITPQNATGSCLDVSGASTADGALVDLWTYNGGNNQQWGIWAP